MLSDIWLIEEIQSKINSVPVLDSNSADRLKYQLADMLTPTDVINEIMEFEFDRVTDSNIVETVLINQLKGVDFHKSASQYALDDIVELGKKLNNGIEFLSDLTNTDIEIILAYLEFSRFEFIYPKRNCEIEKTNLAIKRVRIGEYYMLIIQLKNLLIERIKNK